MTATWTVNLRNPDGSPLRVVTEQDGVAIYLRAVGDSMHVTSTAGPHFMSLSVPAFTEALDVLGVQTADAGFDLVRDVLVKQVVDRARNLQVECERLQAALLHIATGGISPSIGFAQRILLGASVADAHRAESAFMFDGVKPVCARCRDMSRCVDMHSFKELRVYDCPDCKPTPIDTENMP